MRKRKPKRATTPRNRKDMSEISQQEQKSPLEVSRKPTWRPDIWLGSIFDSGSSAGASNMMGMENSSSSSSSINLPGARGGGGRRRRPSGGILAIFSTLCAALLWVGALSFSRSQLPAGAGSNSTRRTQERGGNAGGAAAAGEGGGGEAAQAGARSATKMAVPSPRKLARRPELKTRGGQLAVAPYSLLAEFPHDSMAFTQGLCYQDGFLYESTGLFGGKSSVRKVATETGEVLQHVNLKKEHFGEGMVILKDEIHSLTWRSNVGFTWDLQSFELKKEFSFTTKTEQGWGITTDGTSLVVSDGSSFLFFWDPETMQETRRVQVLLADGRQLTHINELEMVKGYVLANVWFDTHVYKIDPATGTVVDKYDFSELYPKALQKKELTSREAVLNGIAWDPVEDVLYLTGKLWPRMYKVKLHGEGEDGPREDEEGEAVDEEGWGNDDPKRRQLLRRQ